MRIVYGTDLSNEALAGARLSFALADFFRKSGQDVDIEVLHVTRPERMRLDKGRELQADPDNQRRIEQAVRKWVDEALGEEDFELSLGQGKPAEVISERAASTEADYLVLGQTGMGAFARMTLGSTAHKIAQAPPCKLLLAKSDFTEFDAAPRIIVGVDLDDSNRAPLKEAANLAHKIDADLHIISVIMPPQPVIFPGGLIGYSLSPDEEKDLVDEAHTSMRALLDTHRDILKGLVVRSHVLSGSPARHLVEYSVNQSADILVIGSGDADDRGRFLIGTIASTIVRHMPCTTLLVPPGS